MGESATLAAMFLLLALIGCAPSPDLTVTLDIVDEQGLPIDGAQVLAGRESWFADGGSARLNNLQGPISGVVSADGYLSEPFIVGRVDHRATRTIRLWDDSRWALHAGGDVMLGRRYEEPGGLLETDQAAGAAQVVSNLAPLFAVSDIGIVNFESVLSNLSASGAYAGKRYVINTPSQAATALTAMGVDVVGLANNHSRDWLDDGISITRDALRDADIASVGGRETSEGVSEPVILQVGDVTVGVLAYTTLSGSFVNNAYPTESDAVPQPLDPDLAFQYDARSWSYDGDDLQVEVADRRIGTAWRLFADAEAGMSDAEIADAYASLTAVYPEVQDWVARRGHGGAASWTQDSPDDISRLNEQVDVVVVMIHGGYELATAPSVTVRDVAESSAAAGADLVIGHHPHVLHGAEWLGDALIVHSLGNLIFEQNNPLTQASAMLRTVWDGDELLQASFLPLELVDYRPVFVADAAALRTLNLIHETSQAHAEAHVSDGMVLIEPSESETRPATVTITGHTALLGRDTVIVETLNLSVRPNRLTNIPANILVDPGLNTTDPNIWVGRDLFGWGHFEDVVADGVSATGAHWLVDSEWERIEAKASAPEGNNVLHLQRDVFNDATVTTRSEGQYTIIPHRLWEDGEPVDPEARYAVFLRAKLKGPGTPSLRLQGFEYERGSLAIDPVTTELFDEDIPLDVGSGWTEILIDVDPEWLVVGVNRLRPSLRLAPPERGNSQLFVDDVHLLELRPAALMPSDWGRWDVVQTVGDERVDLTVPVLR